MTIIAGFKCHEGLVLCADTQETVGNVSKRNVPKNA
jgi:20S proteasome alpha/beta subunit